MAKRFTDTDKWKRPWFSNLELTAKLIWIYLLDDCDHRGVWYSNFRRISFDLGFEVTAKKLSETFGNKIIEIDEDKYFIPSFIEFQYGELDPSNRAHKNIILFLRDNKIINDKAPSEGLNRTIQGDKDKDTDKVKDKENYIPNKKIQEFPFDEIYALYPLKLGKSAGLKICKKEIKSEEDFIKCKSAVQNYAQHVKANITEKKFIKHFSTFMSSWKDWVQKDVGSVSIELGESKGVQWDKLRKDVGEAS